MYPSFNNNKNKKKLEFIKLIGKFNIHSIIKIFCTTPDKNSVNIIYQNMFVLNIGRFILYMYSLNSLIFIIILFLVINNYFRILIICLYTLYASTSMFI
jgi:hypothetical protein